MSRSRSRSPSQRKNQLYIGYLPNHATMDDVEDFFKGYGTIKSINLKPGYGFVIFEDDKDAADAVRDLDGKRMCGETVDIQHAKGPGNKARDARPRSDGPLIRDDRNRNGRKVSNFSRRSRSYSRSRSPSPIKGAETDFMLKGR